MYPPSPAKCLKQLKSFTPPKIKEALPLPILPKTPTKAIHTESILFELEHKILEPLSSATKPRVQSLIKGTKEIFTYSQLQEQELKVVQARRTKEVQRKVNKRKVVQKYGGLTIRDTEAKLAEKARKEGELLKKKQDREFKRLLNIEKKIVYSQGVQDRRAKRERKKRVKELAQGGQEVPSELLVPIIDREAVWKEEAQLTAQLAQEEEEDEEVLFTIDTQGDRSLVPKLDQDYIPIPSSPPLEGGSQWWREATAKEDDIEARSNGSEVYNEDMDYSWDNRK